MQVDYKSTLNLPRTNFPMKAELAAREPERLARWQAGGLYARVQATRAGRKRFVLHDGPPFANGDVHIGTAGNKILKDMVVKSQALRGRHAPYVPGWDCHGLPIEFKVTQELRQAGRTNADPVTIRRACDDYARKYIDLQRRQFQRLGVLGDWENPYLTLDKEYEAEELRLFADLVERGFVYRGKKPVYWSIPCRTALAEAEVEYRDHVSQSIYVKFPVIGQPGVHVLIWTTTPWTLPANLAIAYNSTLSYSLVRMQGEACIASTLLLGQLFEKCGVEYEIIRSLDAAAVSQIEVQHPFCARQGRLFAGDAFVDNASGTGFVHIAPGHGLEDYGLGRQHGLPIYSPVDDDGRFAYTNDLPVEEQMPRVLIGKSILEQRGRSAANEAVLALLRERGLLLHQEHYRHSYPHCWRSKTPVIFRAMDQWFIALDHVPGEPGAAPARTGVASTPVRPDDGAAVAPEAGARRTFRTCALEEINRVRWIPDWGRNRIEAAVKGRPDWCISRQRSWGVPIPAFYDDQGGPILDARIVRRAADLIESHGSNVWFEESAGQLWALLRPKDWQGPEAAAKGGDTLDVWIDSGSSSRAVIARRPELRGAERPFQCDLYLEGSDQHRGWFQSSLLLSLAANGTAPYRAVLTHGFMVDADRMKISKSNQAQLDSEKPQSADAYVRKWGADIIRLWVASQDFRNDIIVSEERINKVAEVYRVLRNALRYQLSNLYDFDPAKHAVADERLTGLDRWVLAEFGRLEAEVAAAYDAYEFHVVYQKLSQFAAIELSAIYHDVVKDRLYTDPANSHRRRSTQTALHRIVTRLCKMLAPILSFTADEAWEFVPGRSEASAHETEWEPDGLVLLPEETDRWRRLFKLREEIFAAMEKERQAKRIGKSLEAVVRLRLVGEDLALVREHQEVLTELLNVSSVEIEEGKAPSTIRSGPAEAQVEADWRILVRHAKGYGRKKCARCWRWEPDVGACREHPAICGRCVRAVAESAEGRPL